MADVRAKAIKSAAQVTFNCGPAKTLQCITTQASATIEMLETNIVSRTEAMKRSPRVAARSEVVTGSRNLVCSVESIADGTMPDSSNRYCPAGIGSLQNAQQSACGSVCLWQRGHSMCGVPRWH